MADKGSARGDWLQAFLRANCGVAFVPRSMADSARPDCTRTADAAIVRKVCVLAQADPAALALAA